MPEPRRVTDLVPHSRWAILLMLSLGLVVVGLLEGLYAWMPRLAAHTSDGRIMAFDLDSEGSLAAWFSSTTLLAASLVTWLVYSVRRHQPDDYRGRYGVWRWAALTWAVMSIDESSSLHEGFKEAMTMATGQRLAGDGSLWWVLGYAPVLAYVGLALVWEVRRWWGTLAWLCLTAGCFGAAVAVQLEWIWPQGGARAVMLEEGLEMAGNLTLLSAMLWHARLMILVSQGKLPLARAASEGEPAVRKTRRAKTVESPAEEEAPTRSTRAAAPLAAKVASSAQAAGRASATASDRQLRVDPPQTLDSQRLGGLSRADRKALKRQLRQRDREQLADDE